MPVSANWPEYALMMPILMVSAACAGAPAASATANPARPHRSFCIASSLIFIVLGTLVALILLQLRGERNAPLAPPGKEVRRPFSAPENPVTTGVPRNRLWHEPTPKWGRNRRPRRGCPLLAPGRRVVGHAWADGGLAQIQSGPAGLYPRSRSRAFRPRTGEPRQPRGLAFPRYRMRWRHSVRAVGPPRRRDGGSRSVGREHRGGAGARRGGRSCHRLPRHLG